MLAIQALATILWYKPYNNILWVLYYVCKTLFLQKPRLEHERVLHADGFFKDSLDDFNIDSAVYIHNKVFNRSSGFVVNYNENKYIVLVFHAGKALFYIPISWLYRFYQQSEGSYVLSSTVFCCRDNIYEGNMVQNISGQSMILSQQHIVRRSVFHRGCRLQCGRGVSGGRRIITCRINNVYSSDLVGGLIHNNYGNKDKLIFDSDFPDLYEYCTNKNMCMKVIVYMMSNAFVMYAIHHVFTCKKCFPRFDDLLCFFHEKVYSYEALTNTDMLFKFCPYGKNNDGPTDHPECSYRVSTKNVNYYFLCNGRTCFCKLSDSCDVMQGYISTIPAFRPLEPYIVCIENNRLIVDLITFVLECYKE